MDVWARFNKTQWKNISTRFMNTAQFLGLMTEEEAKAALEVQGKSKEHTINLLFAKLLDKALGKIEKSHPL